MSAKLAAAYGGLVSLFVLVGLTHSVTGQTELDQGPVKYSTSEPHNRLEDLRKSVANGKAHLDFDEQHGYLRAVLKALDVPNSSQMLAFSKTSLFLGIISPRTPRALYFNDDTYVGWVQGARFIELSAADPELGAVFYRLEQRHGDRPVMTRETRQCLNCHGLSGVPGHLMLSTYVDSTGRQIPGSATFLTSHSSPWSERWGGWYATGTHGGMRHMGNSFYSGRGGTEIFDHDAGANVTDLSSRFDLEPYLTPHSDLVALLVLAHQTTVHNQLTVANHSARLAAAEAMNDARLDRSRINESDSVQRRYASAAEDLLEALLLVGEAPLTDPIAGTSSFAAEFAQRGPFDRRGRSLRQFDLQTRMFRYPCSFLIYSDSFDRLPPGVLEMVYRRLREVLTNRDASPRFAHLSTSDRRAILEILRDTKPRLPDYFRTD